MSEKIRASQQIIRSEQIKLSQETCPVVDEEREDNDLPNKTSSNTQAFDQNKQAEPIESDRLSAAEYLKLILRAPVYEVAKKTSLDLLKRLSARLDNQVFLKREDQQVVHSFKIRGAYNMLSHLSDAQKQSGIVAASAGNHAQGVALSGAKLGLETYIVMPKTTPEIKTDAVKSYGAQVILHGNSFDEAKQYAQELSSLHGYTFIPPFDHPLIIAGQGTLALEIVQQQAHLDAVFIPVGGGGLAAGVAVLIKQLMPEIKVIGVEPMGSSCLSSALEQGMPVTLDSVNLFADGVAVKRVGEETFRLCHQYLDDCIQVSSDEICAAVKDVFEDTRAIAEPSGALALAGLKAYLKLHQWRGKQVATVLSGANTNFHGLRYISERCELGEKREGLLAVNIPEQQGAFLAFCQCLGKRSVTEFNYRFNGSAQASVFVGIRLQEGSGELVQIIHELKKNDYNVIDLSEDEMAKLHIRYMIGGRPKQAISERLYSFEFPEYPGALLKFLQTLGTHWNITLFNYRSQGADHGRVLCGFELTNEEHQIFHEHLAKLDYQYKDETHTLAYRFFCRK